MGQLNLKERQFFMICSMSGIGENQTWNTVRTMEWSLGKMNLSPVWIQSHLKFILRYIWSYKKDW